MSENHSEIALQRFKAMGISARLMQDERCVIASMTLGKAAFPGPLGPQRFEGVLFTTVGADQIKCLRPRALFQLPIISIRGCREAASIESRIRAAWEKQTAEMARTRDWLNTIGADASPIEAGAALSIAIEGEGPNTRATMIDRHQVVLPSSGPLAGVTLDSPEQRVMELSSDISSGLSLDIAVSARLKELSKRAAAADEDGRHLALTIAPAVIQPSQNSPGSDHLLVVGPRLATDRAFVASLRLRGYNVSTALNLQDALLRYNRASPQLVVADVELGRSDGIELVIALRNLAGVEDLPVILVDDRARPARREAARQVGAVGYIVHPIDVSRIAKHLTSIITSPRPRRFTRYSSRLPVQAAGKANPLLVASAVGRGGMYLSTPNAMKLNTTTRYQLSLPDVGQTLQVDAQVVYMASMGGFQGHGVGLQFRDFPGSHEQRLIEFLQTLDKTEDSL